MKRFLILSVLTSLVLGLASCATGSNKLTGAGASFPAPLYAKMFDIYKQDTGVTVEYESVGSGTGIRFIIEKTVDFGASDKPMSAKKMKEAGAPMLHIPTALGAVVLAYNLPIKGKIKMDSSIVAGIFMGKITTWDDAQIVALNPGMDLPNTTIKVVHRSDGSGTTFAFTDYLSVANKAWADNIGKGKSVKWPVGNGGKGNEGVASSISQNPGSIGYLSLSFAQQNNLPVVSLKNKSGNFIEPTINSVSLAATGPIPAHTRVSIVDTAASKGYPIASFTWLLVYQEQKYQGKSIESVRTLVNLLNWIIHDGQKINETLLYAPIPKSAVKKAEAIIDSITYGGKVIK